MGLLKKKNDDGGESSSRMKLFGSKNKDKSSANVQDNPYANAPPDAYTQAKMRAGVIPGQQGGLPSQMPTNSHLQSNVPQVGAGGYGQPLAGYAQNRFAPPAPGQQQGGYGSNPYASDNKFGPPGQASNPYSQMNQVSGTSRTGGYGGLGSVNDPDAPDDNRDALFGAAKDRLQQRQPNGPPDYQYNNGQDPSQEASSYGAYGDRQLTAEEEEEEDIQATKQEIRFMKQQDVSSTRNALQAAAMAEETGRNTLARLGAQGERLYNTDRNLDIGHNAINTAEDKSKEIKKLNRSMFAVHVNNPFTAKERRIRDEEKIMDRHHMEREQREAIREATFKNQARMNDNFKNINERSQNSEPKQSLAERSKYQFEADSDDERMEDEIDRNIDELGGAAKRLNLLARAMGDEADQQNAHLQKISEKSDRLDDRLHLQTERLKRIK